MGQLEVFKFLEKQRELNDKWFTTKDIREALKSEGLSNGYLDGINSDLLKLANFKLIEMRGVGIWEHYKEWRGIKNIYKNE